MCLAIPGKVLSIDKEVQPVMGNVNFAGINRQVCLEWLPDVQVGEYVLVHVGFALSKLDEKEAQETLDILKQMDGEFDELKNSDPE
ncbi:MAG: HypC/HybG/HupF family hydrogenase formation chaperone [Bacteroidota bacterium]|jgi:hydrogenase expression/formation protein HypC